MQNSYCDHRNFDIVNQTIRLLRTCFESLLHLDEGLSKQRNNFIVLNTKPLNEADENHCSKKLPTKYTNKQIIAKQHRTSVKMFSYFIAYLIVFYHTNLLFYFTYFIVFHIIYFPSYLL
jgi:hypothetical protein